MKFHSLFLPALAVAGMASSLAQEATTPVGYFTIPLPGTGGSTPQKLQIASTGLLPAGAQQYSGTITAATASYIEDTNGTWTAGDYVGANSQYNHVVEITSGSLAGSMTWITASDDSSGAGQRLSTADDLSAADGETFRVLKTFTVSSLLGATPTDDVLKGGSNPSAADNLLILDPLTGNYTQYYYKNSGLGQGWKKDALGGTFPDDGIFPTDGLVIVRKQETDGSLLIAGEVRESATNVSVIGNGTSNVLNIVSIPSPVEQITLDTSGLYTGDDATGLKGGSNPSSADNLLVLNAATGNYTQYYFKNSGLGQGWKKDALSGTFENDTIPAGSAVLIVRKSNTTFTWNIPGVNVPQ